MKTKLLVLLIVSTIAIIAACFVGYQYYMKQPYNPGVKDLAKKNSAIIYCSYGEGIKDIVNIIDSKLKTDIIELKPAVAYPADKTEFIKRIDKENADISKVILDNKDIDLKKYKLVILATPVLQNHACPVIQKFLDNNVKSFDKKAVTTIVKFSEGQEAKDTLEYFYYKLFNAYKKPDFLTNASNKEQLNYETDLWFNEMKFTREELK